MLTARPASSMTAREPSDERDREGQNPYREDVRVTGEDGNPYTAPLSRPASDAFAKHYNLATRGDRLGGVIIDWLFGVACLVPGFVVAALSDSTNNPSLEPVAGLLVFIGMIAPAAIQWTLITRTSQSVGKRVVQTRIIQLDGSPPGFLHGVFLRSWVLGLTCMCYPVGGIVYLVDALAIFGEKRQCLHDMIASTLVISDKETSANVGSPRSQPDA